MSARLENLRAVLRERELEALLILSPANRRYISGFSGSAGVLLITSDRAIIFTDFRYRIQAIQEAPAFTLCEIGIESPLHRLLAETAAEMGLRQLAFEAAHTSVAQFNRIKATLDEHTPAPHTIALVPVENIVEPLREVKDAEELAALRHAIAITDAAITSVLPLLTPTHTERQAAWMLEAAMRERGADGLSFPIIVAAGPNSARPHAQPGDAPLGSGQPIVIDMGALYKGYHADLTRTVVLGEPDERFWHIYNIVLEAQQQAIGNLRAGLTGAEADALARNHIATAGFGQAFGHSLGHGVGLDIHEGPTLRYVNDQPLHAGSVFSVEPGIYLEDWGGVRIEDLVLLQEQGCLVLSQATKQPALR